MRKGGVLNRCRQLAHDFLCGGSESVKWKGFYLSTKSGTGVGVGRAVRREGQEFSWGTSAGVLADRSAWCGLKPVYNGFQGYAFSSSSLALISQQCDF